MRDVIMPSLEFQVQETLRGLAEVGVERADTGAKGFKCHRAVGDLQLKVIQEVITVVVFSIFSILYLKECFRWNYLIAFGFLISVVFLCLKNKPFLV